MNEEDVYDLYDIDPDAVLRSDSPDIGIARRQIRRWSEVSPEYARVVEAVRSMLHNHDRRDVNAVGYRVLLSGQPHTACHDESFVASASASLGMGTKHLPSRQYGGH